MQIKTVVNGYKYNYMWSKIEQVGKKTSICDKPLIYKALEWFLRRFTCSKTEQVNILKTGSHVQFLNKIGGLLVQLLNSQMKYYSVV